MSAPGIARKFSGASAELLVAADMLREGYDVYRAVGQHAPFDLIAYRDGKCLRVEVRTAQERVDGSLSPNCKATDTGDLYAFVCGDRIEYVPFADVSSKYRLIRSGHAFAS